MHDKVISLFVFMACLVTSLACLPAATAEENLPLYLRDRGTGIPTSMFGTYVRAGELLVYPFIEYYRDSDYEYAPEELGYEGEVDYRGKYRGIEALIFIGYGLNDHWALEFEAGVIQASLEKSPDDPSGMPDKVEESGLSDVEGQIRYRWFKEKKVRPELFNYFECAVPTQEKGSLIGTTDWEFKLGMGVVKGFRWGTMTLRGAFEYDMEEERTELGETAVEYLKRLSPQWRVFLAVEGAEDEWECIPEIQWHFRPNMFLKLNSAFALTSKAEDWAPEIGLMISF